MIYFIGSGALFVTEVDRILGPEVSAKSLPSQSRIHLAGRLFEEEKRKVCMGKNTSGKTVAKKKAKKKVPSKKGSGGHNNLYTEKLATLICTRLSKGESLRTICKTKGMPEMHTIFRWCLAHEEFQKDYAVAREMWADAVYEETLEMADRSGSVITGKDRSDSARISAVKLAVDTRRWALARMNPKKYGEKMDVTSGNKPFKEPRRAVITYVIPKEPAAK